MRSIIVLFCLALAIPLFSCGGIKSKKASTETISQTVTKITYQLDTVSNSGVIELGSRDLGVATNSEKLFDSFSLKNMLTEPIVIKSIKTNCGCVELEYDLSPIKPNESKAIKYSYNTRGKGAGYQMSEIVISTDKGNYTVIIELEIR